MAQPNRFAKIIRTIGVTGGAFAVNYLITLVLTPFITDRVGTEAYGFVSLAKNIAQYATYATIALNSFSIRFISLDYHRKQFDQANIYFNSTLFGDVGLATVIFAGLLFVTAFLEKIFHIPAELVEDVKLLFLFVFIKYWVVTVFSAFQSSAYIADKLDLTGIFKGLSYLIEAASLLLLFHFFKTKVFFVGVGILLAECVVVGTDYYIYKRFTPELKIRIGSFRFSAVKNLVVNGIWASINSMGAFLNSGLDLAVCNLMLSPLEMGQLAIAQSLDLIFKSIYTLVAKAFQPTLLKTYSSGNLSKLVKEFKLACKLSGFFTNLMFAGFSAVGLVYLKLWIPNQDIPFVFYLSIMSMIPSVTSGIIYPIAFVYTLLLKRKIPCFFTLLSGALNVAGMYIMIRYFDLGIHAVVWTTIVLMTAVNFIAHPLYASHCMGLNWKTFYPVIVRGIISCAAMVFIFQVLSRLYMPGSWGTLILCIILYSFIGVAVFFVTALDKDERRTVIRALKGRIRLP